MLDSAEGKYRCARNDIISDAKKLDGWEVARHAREMDPAFPVVYMSGDSAEDRVSKGVAESIMLTKPFAPARLVTAVAQLLNGRMPAA